MAISKVGKLTAIDYAIKGLERNINTNKNPKIQEIYRQELNDLQEWKSEIAAQK